MQFTVLLLRLTCFLYRETRAQGRHPSQLFYELRKQTFLSLFSKFREMKKVPFEGSCASESHQWKFVLIAF